jgi:hypothetical protein
MGKVTTHSDFTHSLQVVTTLHHEKPLQIVLT